MSRDAESKHITDKEAIEHMRGLLDSIEDAGPSGLKTILCVKDAEALCLTLELHDWLTSEVAVLEEQRKALRSSLDGCVESVVRLKHERDLLKAEVRALETQPQDELPRRNNLDRMTKAERAIYDAMRRVEAMPADSLLTCAVLKLQEALSAVADYVDVNPPKPCGVGDGSGHACLKTSGHDGPHQGPSGWMWGGPSSVGGGMKL